MNKIYFNNGLRMQCLDVEHLSMVQFDRSAASFASLLPAEKIKSATRIIATGCGDSYLAAVAARGAFSRFLPDVEYETPTGIEAGRYIELAEQEPNTIVVAISVSGGPARVSEALLRGNAHGCTTVALTDNPESRAARSARYLYHTNTPHGDNISGLRTYYVSMISLYVMAAIMAEIRSGRQYLSELRAQVEEYKTTFFREITQMDDICFQTALSWRNRNFFEVTADGPLFFCGKFIAAKVAELSGDVCSVIDSENYFHVNSILYPGSEIAEMNLIVSYENNVDRIADTVNAQVRSNGRSVIVFCDREPRELGITEEVTWCPMAVPPQESCFLVPLFAYIPASILASYRAATIGEPFFRGGTSLAHMTLGTNPVKIV